MLPVSLYDSLRFSKIDEPIVRLSGRFHLPRNYQQHVSKASDGLGDFWGEKNLVHRAAQLILDRAGRQNGVSIELTKRIPAEAGLGGASSDAATTLVALNRLLEVKMSGDDLQKLAEQLGSDVPFFLKNQPAVCTGRGEFVAPLRINTTFDVVICKPPVGLSTAKVYGNCKIPQEVSDSKELQNSLMDGDAYNTGRKLRNRLEDFARPLTNWIEKLDYQFSQLGSLGHQMSGSGTSYFGVFANHKTALRAAKRLSSRLPTNFVFVGRTLAPRGS